MSRTWFIQSWRKSVEIDYGNASKTARAENSLIGDSPEIRSVFRSLSSPRYVWGIQTISYLLIICLSLDLSFLVIFIQRHNLNMRKYLNQIKEKSQPYQCPLLTNRVQRINNPHLKTHAISDALDTFCWSTDSCGKRVMRVRWPKTFQWFQWQPFRLSWRMFWSMLEHPAYFFLHQI
jgi:hypothetical protein